MGGHMSKFFSDKRVQFIVVLLLSSVCLLIPCGEQYTMAIKKYVFLTVFAVLCVACSLCPLVVIAVLLPVSYLFSNVADMKTIYAPWTSQALWMMFGAFVLCYALEECGIMQRISYSILRMFGKSFNLLLYGIYFVGIVLAIITFNGHYVLMTFLAYAICQALGYSHQKESLLILGVGVLAGMNTKIFAYRPATMKIMLDGVQTIDPDFIMTMPMQMQYAFPSVVISLGFIWFLTKVYKTKNVKFAGGRTYFREKYQSLGKMSVQEKKGAVLLTILMAWILTERIHGLPAALAFMTLPWLCFVPGIDIASEKSVRRLDWGIMFFIAVCLSIGGVGTKLGVTSLISDAITPYLEQVTPLGFLYLVLSIGTLLNFILTPVALMATLPAPVTAIADKLGMDPSTPLITIIYATDMILLPFEAAAYLIIFGFGLMSFKDFFKLHSLKCLWYFIMFGVVQVPWWYLFDIIYKK